jgi:hypothetical protein
VSVTGNTIPANPNSHRGFNPTTEGGDQDTNEEVGRDGAVLSRLDNTG